MRMKNLFTFILLGTITISAFLGCSKQDSILDDLSVNSKNRVSVLKKEVVDSIIYSNVKHDSLWHIEFTLDEAVALGVPEERYNSLVDNLNDVNISLRECYQRNIDVVFPDQNEPMTKFKPDEDPEWYTSATISDQYDCSTHVSFSSINSTVAFVVNYQFLFWNISINGTYFSGMNGARLTIQNHNSTDSSGRYSWYFYIKSNTTIVAPHFMRIDFFNINA